MKKSLFAFIILAICISMPVFTDEAQIKPINIEKNLNKVVALIGDERFEQARVLSIALVEKSNTALCPGRSTGTGSESQTFSDQCGWDRTGGRR